MKNRALFFSLLVLLVLNACVKKKLYSTEKLLRLQSQARESVLNKDIADRRREATKLIDTIGVLNRIIGRQEETIKNLQFEVSLKSAQFGESSGRLAQEKMKLESELSETRALLSKRESALNRIYAILNVRKDILSEHYVAINEVYSTWLSVGVSFSYSNESLVLTLPDVHLFDPNGLNVSGSGLLLLLPLAKYLTVHPELDVDIICHTDNTLPRDKTIKDTWDWSLQRANSIVRILIRDYNVNANQLTPIGKGEYYPVSSNESSEGRGENRRTEICIKPVIPTVNSEN